MTYSRKPTSLLKHLIAVRVALSTAPIAFVISFLDSEGLDRLEKVMVTLAVLPQNKGDMNEQIVGEVLKCLRVIMNVDVSQEAVTYCSFRRTNCQIGLSYVLDRQRLITTIVCCIRLPTFKLRCLAADMLGAICLISAQGHEQVLDSLADAKTTLEETYRFEYLLSSLSAYTTHCDDEESDAGVWEWRTSVMGLINAVAGSGDEVEGRCEIRGELKRRGLDHIVDSLMDQEPTQTFMVQAEIYQQESEDDLAELRQLNIEHLVYLPKTLVDVQEEDEEGSDTRKEEEQHDGHLVGLYEEISDLRAQVCRLIYMYCMYQIDEALTYTSLGSQKES